MNKKHFEIIEQAAADFIKRVDAIIPGQQVEAKSDHYFADAVQSQRREARRAAAEFAINDGAKAAREKATAEVEAMRTAFKKYMTATSDPGALQSLQALVNAGVELTPAEVEAYAATGDYATLRILEPHSKGRVTAPSVEAFEQDMRAILGHFDMLTAYSGPACELAEAVTARPWGQSARVNGAILKGTIPTFPGKLAEIAARWEIVRE